MYNIAAGCFANEGKLLFDAKYLRDLAYDFDPVGACTVADTTLSELSTDPLSRPFTELAQFAGVPALLLSQCDRHKQPRRTRNLHGSIAIWLSSSTVAEPVSRQSSGHQCSRHLSSDQIVSLMHNRVRLLLTVASL